MKAIMVMYDSLRRDLLGCNGGPVPTPNFARLAAHSVSFSHNYVGSLPCMPARRELHTGRLNFLHRSWSPIEPFDDSMPQILKQNGIHTHLTTDHYHYFEDGGATYHTRYSTWQCHRGQESDAWADDLSTHDTEFAPVLLSPESASGSLREMRKKGGWQTMANRTRIKQSADFPMHKTFDDGLDFMWRNAKNDSWFLQIETFDPHEPFVSPDEFSGKYASPDEPFQADWPPYAPVQEDDATVQKVRNKYFALTEFCDEQLGRVLNAMDALDLWNDTMLIVNTDHGFFLSEHGWWGKGSEPNYEELVHTPLYIWDPRTQVQGQTRNSVTQTIDLAPTLLDYFNIEIPADMMGKPLAQTIQQDTPVRRYAMFGYHGSPIGITDGRWVLLRAVADASVPVYEYTHMPTHMRFMFSLEEMCTAEMHRGFSFTKGAPVMKIKTTPNFRFATAQKEGEDLLFDLQTDPAQQTPLHDEAKKQELLTELARLVQQNDAPTEIYARYALASATQ